MHYNFLFVAFIVCYFAAKVTEIIDQFEVQSCDVHI